MCLKCIINSRKMYFPFVLHMFGQPIYDCMHKQFRDEKFQDNDWVETRL